MKLAPLASVRGSGEDGAPIEKAAPDTDSAVTVNAWDAVKVSATVALEPTVVLGKPTAPPVKGLCTGEP